MRVGTKSVLFGAHAFWLHPWFVALGWWFLFGFPWDPRLWVAFFIHDLGYVGKRKMDDEDGENHPEFGAGLMHFLFDWPRRWKAQPYSSDPRTWVRNERWYHFVKYHSRFLATKNGHFPSRLCYADKLAIVLTPWWLYIPMVRLTGEIREYRSVQKHVDEMPTDHADHSWAADIKWFQDLQVFMEQWVRDTCPTWAMRRING